MTTVDFLGIGAQKCGTTWLFRQLSRHPQVAFPRGKELHHWDKSPHPDADEWVAALQPSARTSPDGRRMLAGEITPAYAIIPPQHIRAIRERCPDIRLFISLRHPIERAWSHAVMVLIRSGMMPVEASDNWFLDHFRSVASRSRGDYAACLERWWSEFPRERLLILFMEDISARPAAVLDALAAHLAIDATEFARLPNSAIREVVRPPNGAGGEFGNPPPIRPSLVAPLMDMYADGIDRLARLIDRDISHWRGPPLPQPPTPACSNNSPPSA